LVFFRGNLVLEIFRKTDVSAIIIDLPDTKEDIAAELLPEPPKFIFYIKN